MQIDNDAFREILWEDHEDFEPVTETLIEDQSRWSIYKSKVFRHKPSGKLFQAFWGEGATEYQDGQDEYWSLVEVEPVEVTVVKYNEISAGQKFEGNM
jgi:hypothetical protein